MWVRPADTGREGSQDKAAWEADPPPYPGSENGEPLSKSEIKKRQKAEEKERLKAEKAKKIAEKEAAEKAAKNQAEEVSPLVFSFLPDPLNID